MYRNYLGVCQGYPQARWMIWGDPNDFSTDPVIVGCWMLGVLPGTVPSWTLWSFQTSDSDESDVGFLHQCHDRSPSHYGCFNSKSWSSMMTGEKLGFPQDLETSTQIWRFPRIGIPPVIIHTNLEVSKNRDTPSHHPFSIGMNSPKKQHPFLGPWSMTIWKAHPSQVAETCKKGSVPHPAGLNTFMEVPVIIQWSISEVLDDYDYWHLDTWGDDCGFPIFYEPSWITDMVIHQGMYPILYYW